MNNKKPRSDKYIANIYFLLMMAAMWGVNFIPLDMMTRVSDSFIMNATLSELLIVIPALIMIVVWLMINKKGSWASDEGESPHLSDRLMFRSLKPSTFLMTILYAFTISPVVTLCNLISQLFVDNTVLEYSSDILDMSVPMAVFVIAILPPFCEELAFRGVVYGGYRRNCRPIGAIFMSAFLFGIMHGNINQFAYAFVIGIAMALIVEATGSIWPSILLHFIINGRSVVGMFLLDHFQEGIFEEYLEMEESATDETMWIFILVYAILSVITVLMSGAILSWVSQNEGRSNPLKDILANKKYKTTRVTVWSVSLVIGIAAAIAMIVMVELYT